MAHLPRQWVGPLLRSGRRQRLGVAITHLTPATAKPRADRYPDTYRPDDQWPIDPGRRDCLKKVVIGRHAELCLVGRTSCDRDVELMAVQIDQQQLVQELWSRPVLRGWSSLVRVVC